ncbi:MAG: alpha/beta hydrolase [Anaerolineae bacterium]|nr:alpha/beta hydrolase [Anaerolineae bacterium]
MGDVLLNTGLVHYEVMGHGESLLFLHDWLGSSRYWVPSMMDLSSAYRSYALDFWGFGASDKVVTRYKVEEYVKQLVEFMDQLQLYHIPLIGHGLGGVVALLTAARYPEKARQVMAIGVPLAGEYIARVLSDFRGSDNPAQSILGRRLNLYDEVVIEAPRTDSSAIVESLKSVLVLDLQAALSSIEVPVLLIYGQQDPIVEPPVVELINELKSNMRVFLLKKAQHYPMLEDTMMFKRLLLNFLMYRGDWESIFGIQERLLWSH